MNEKPIIGILGPSAVGKTTMLSLLEQTGEFHVLKQLTCRQERSDDGHFIECLSTTEFRSMRREDFLVRHGNYGILNKELEVGLESGKPMVAVMGVFEIVQLKTSIWKNVLAVLLQFPQIDVDFIRQRMRGRTNFNVEERVFEGLVYQDVFYTDGDYLEEYIDLVLSSEPALNSLNIDKIRALVRNTLL